MAYFYCGTEADSYAAEYCRRCVHDTTQVQSCPVWFLHLEWNYDAAGDDADPAKKQALDLLWPSDPETGQPGQCAMFVETEREHERKRERDIGRMGG